MKTIFYPENERGKNNIGWLKANFSFSFASYYDADKVHFGALRVLNDDTIAAGTGFGTHPHDNMEIITIPLEGGLEHKDSMGNTGVISAGEVQVCRQVPGFITQNIMLQKPGRPKRSRYGFSLKKGTYSRVMIRRVLPMLCR